MAPLGAHARVDRSLRGDLVRGVLAEEAALTRVRALGVLAHDEHVDAVVEPVRARQERAEVHEEVELEAEREEQAPLDHARRDAGGADRAEHHRVELADGVEVLLLEDHAVAQVPAPAQVEGHGLVVDAGRVDALHRLGDDFGADAVPADDPDPVAHESVLDWWFDNAGNEKPPDSGDGVDGWRRTPESAPATKLR